MPPRPSRATRGSAGVESARESTDVPASRATRGSRGSRGSREEHVQRHATADDPLDDPNLGEVLALETISEVWEAVATAIVDREYDVRLPKYTTDALLSSMNQVIAWSLLAHDKSVFGGEELTLEVPPPGNFGDTPSPPSPDLFQAVSTVAVVDDRASGRRWRAAGHVVREATRKAVRTNALGTWSCEDEPSAPTRDRWMRGVVSSVRTKKPLDGFSGEPRGSTDGVSSSVDAADAPSGSTSPRRASPHPAGGSRKKGARSSKDAGGHVLFECDEHDPVGKLSPEAARAQALYLKEHAEYMISLKLSAEAAAAAAEAAKEAAAAKAAAAAETEKRTSDLKGKRWTVDADGNIIVIKETPIPAKASLGLSTYHSAKDYIPEGEADAAAKAKAAAKKKGGTAGGGGSRPSTADGKAKKKGGDGGVLGRAKGGRPDFTLATGWQPPLIGRDGFHLQAMTTLTEGEATRSGGQPLEDPSHCSRAAYLQRLDDMASLDPRAGRGGGDDDRSVATAPGALGRGRKPSQAASFGGVGDVDPFQGCKQADENELLRRRSEASDLESRRRAAADAAAREADAAAQDDLTQRADWGSARPGGVGTLSRVAKKSDARVKQTTFVTHVKHPRDRLCAESLDANWSGNEKHLPAPAIGQSTGHGHHGGLRHSASAPGFDRSMGEMSGGDDRSVGGGSTVGSGLTAGTTGGGGSFLPPIGGARGGGGGALSSLAKSNSVIVESSFQGMLR